MNRYLFLCFMFIYSFNEVVVGEVTTFTGQIHLPEKYRDIMELSKFKIVHITHEFNYIACDKKGWFKFDLTKNARCSIYAQYYDQELDINFRSKTVYLRGHYTDLEPIKLNVIPERMKLEKPVSMTGKFKLPKKYREIVDLSTVEVRLQHFPSCKMQRVMIQKDGSFKFMSELRGQVKISVHTHDSNISHLLRFIKEIKLTEKDVDVGALDLEVMPQLAVGNKAPNFKAIDVNGKDVQLSDFRGKVVLLDFWATWCRPCVAQTPYIDKMFRKYKDTEKFVVIGLSRDHTKEAASEYFQKKNLEWVNLHIGYAHDQGISDLYGVVAIPQILLVGPDGKVLSKNLRASGIVSEVDKAMEAL